LASCLQFAACSSALFGIARHVTPRSATRPKRFQKPGLCSSPLVCGAKACPRRRDMADENDQLLKGAGRSRPAGTKPMKPRSSTCIGAVLPRPPKASADTQCLEGYEKPGCAAQHRASSLHNPAELSRLVVGEPPRLSQELSCSHWKTQIVCVRNALCQQTRGVLWLVVCDRVVRARTGSCWSFARTIRQVSGRST